MYLDNAEDDLLSPIDYDAYDEHWEYAADDDDDSEGE